MSTMTRNSNSKMKGSSKIRDADACEFDQVLKQLETTKHTKQQRYKNMYHQQHHRRHPSSSTMTVSRHHSDSSDNSSRGTGSSNGSAFAYDSGAGGGEQDDERSSGNSTSEFETRQSFVDRRAGGSITPNSVNSFIERSLSVEKCSVSVGGEVGLHSGRDTLFVEEGLPAAILKVCHVLLFVCISRTRHPRWSCLILVRSYTLFALPKSWIEGMIFQR